MGEPVLTPDSTKEEIEEVFEEDWSFNSEEAQQEVLKSLKEGKSIYRGDVCYDEAEYHYGNIFANIWDIVFMVKVDYV